MASRDKLIGEALLPMLLQLISPGAIQSFGPTTPKHGYELAFAIYISASFILYGLNVFLAVVCLIAIGSDMEESAWPCKAMKLALFAALAISFAAVLLGTSLRLLP